MNAKEFVKKFGWDISIKALQMSTTEFSRAFDIDMGFIITRRQDLKTLVDAYELVREFGGIQKAKSSWNDFEANHQYEFYGTNLDNLKQAIKLVESVGE